MNYSKYQLVVSDLDGTLIKYGSNEVSNAVKQAVTMLAGRGIIFTVATGRSWLQTKQVVRELGLTAPVILQSGAIVIDPVTEVIQRVQPLRNQLELKLRQLPVLPEVDYFCLGESGSYFVTSVNTGGGKWLLDKSGESCQLISGSNEQDNNIIKHLFIGPELALRGLADRILKNIKPKPNLIIWPPDNSERDWFLEVFDPLASKGQALEWLAKNLKIKLNRIIAIGDGHNDLDILVKAGYGVAIADAPSTVRSRAQLVIPGPEEEGVARFLCGELEVG